MKLALSAIINFPIFYEQVKNKKLPIRTAYKLSQIKYGLEPHINFYREQLYKIISEYGSKDKDGNLQKTEDGLGIKISSENSEKCSNKIQELLNLEINLPDYNFSLEEFDRIELTIEDLEAGAFLFNE